MNIHCSYSSAVAILKIRKVKNICLSAEWKIRKRSAKPSPNLLCSYLLVSLREDIWMDPRSTWYQPEQLGPATELWTRIFNSATQNFRDLQMGDSKAGDRNGLNEYESRNRTLPPRDSQDFIPLHGDSGTDLATKRSAINGYQNGERTSSNNIFNKRRKDNLASTYDWNSSGKLRDGGTPWWSRRNAGSHHGLPYPDLTNHNVELGYGLLA